MILEKKVHACSKYHGKAVIKNGKNACGNQQYHCKTCGTYGVLEPHNRRYTEGEEERIIGLIKNDGACVGLNGVMESVAKQ